MTGQKFHKLTVIKYAGLNKYNKALWECECECGKKVTVLSANLKNGNTKSCGCYNLEAIMERNTTHGGRHSRLYNIWIAMKDRCNNENSKIYKHYGARGIKVCREWAQDFRKFMEWSLQNGYTDKLSIDRINYNGDYEPVNCRWATNEQQAWNKRNNLQIEINGVVKTTKQWSDETGIPIKNIYDRIKKGDTEERIIRPVRYRK